VEITRKYQIRKIDRVDKAKASECSSGAFALNNLPVIQ
jgi:hypothetical protein